MSFLRDIEIRQLGLTENVEILRDFGYYSIKHKTVVIIRAGFITDLDSIPPIIKSVVRASPKRSWRGYALHDALYRRGFPKKPSDLILDEALELLEIDWYPRQKVYSGLWLFGSPTTDDELIENALHTIEIYDVEMYNPKLYSEICYDYLNKIN